MADVQKAVADYRNIPSYGQRVHQEANLRRFTSAPDLNPTAELPPSKKEAPAVSAMGKSTEKVDQLKLKMAELASAAQAAQKALADAGKGVDFERANEITREYDKMILELEAHLKTQHKTLSEANKAAIRSSIATRINDESQARFRNEVVLSTEQILAQANAQGILTAAIGQGAAAMRKAQVDAEFKTKYAGQSSEWMAANQDLINKQKAARNAELSAANGQKDTSALDSLKQQVSVQQMLNSAILAGRDATNQARLASEQAAIVKSYADRGDNNEAALNAELAMNEKLFNLKQAEADLNRAASMDPARTFQAEADAISAAAKAAKDAGFAISDMQLRAANKANWDSYVESIDKTKLAVGSASDGVSVFFQEMGRESQSAAQQMHNVLKGAFDSLNNQLENLLTGKKANFSEFFKGVSQSLAHLAVQNVEQGVAGSVLGKLGIGKPASPEVKALDKTNSILKQILGAVRAGGEGGDSGAMDTDSVGSAIGSLARPILNALPGGQILTSIFDGHRALGGDVTAGMSYDVGEMGRETFIPTQNGRIVPNNKLSGGNTIHMPIDARGANDPAAVEMAIHRAMSSYAPQIAAGTTKSINEQRARSPLSKR